MNTDPRGIKRGSCLVENCDCSSYEFEEKNGAKCSYCYCPPTKHKKIDVPVVEKSAEIPSIDTCLETGDFQEHGEYIIQNLVPVPSNVFPVPLCSPQLQDLLPKKLPNQVQSALENRTLTPALRNKIVRAITDKCFEEGVSSKNINVVAEFATQKWSPLKARFRESSASLATQIKRRISKLKLQTKQNDAEENFEIKEITSYNQQEMTIEMAKKNPSILKLKQFLESTRYARKDQVNRTPALEIMNLYPALKIQDLLLWEFTKLVNIDLDTLVQRWKDFIDRMKDYFKRTENFMPLTESYEGLTLDILMKLPSTLPSGKRTAEVTKFVLQIFEENTLADILQRKDDPPRLIGVGDVSKNITLFAYVDGTAMFTEKCPIKAVLLLLSTYWVYNIEFAPEARPSFLLMCSALLKEQMSPKSISKYSAAVNCLLKQLNL